MNHGSFHGSWPYSQPPSGYPIELNQDSPQAKGLVACWMPVASMGKNVLRDIVGGFDGVQSGTEWVSNSVFGPGLRFVSSDIDTVINTSFPILTDNFTVIVFADNIDISATVASIAVGSYSGNHRGWVLSFERYNNTGNVGFTFLGVSDYDSTIATPSGPSVIAATISGGNVRFFVNGQTSTVAIGSMLAANQPGVIIGAGFNGSPLDPADADIFNVLIHNRALSDAEVYEQYRNPWGLVQMHRRVGASATVPSSTIPVFVHHYKTTGAM